MGRSVGLSEAKTGGRPELPVALVAGLILAVSLLAGCSAPVPKDVAPTCDKSLQGLIDSAAPGDVVEAAGDCIYRETVTIDKPITLVAAPGGSQIRGSDVWSGWTEQGSTWVSSGAVPVLAIDDGWKCAPDTRQCRWPEQVFVDGRQLTQVARGTAPGGGQFALNAGRRVILGENPAGKTVEVTVRDHWVEGAASGVTIDGLTMKHAASDGVLDGGYNDWTVKNGDFSYSHTSNVLIKRSTGAVVSGNEIHHAGQKGVAGNELDLVLQGNEIYANNTENFNSSWNAGGVKISNPRAVTFAENTVYGNRGNGLWLDVPTEDQNLVVRDNRVHHNDASGIRSEVTDDVEIYGNVVWENGWGREDSKAAGISVNASHNNHVYDNLVAWNVNGIRVINSRRSEVHPDELEYDSVLNIEVDHNDILMDSPPDGSYALGWVMTINDGNLYDPAANNRGHDNRYWYPAAEGSEKRYAWDVELASLGAFNDTPGEENARYLSNAEKDDLVAANNIPDTPSHRPDISAPSVSITAPAEGTSYAPNETVEAGYSCADEAGGSGLASCRGPVDDGATLDTGSAGSFAFTVTATDNAGNETSLTHKYSVSEGPSSECTITGTPGDDVISGTQGNDTICAGAGKDTIKGLAGNDTLRGEAGTDTARGGPGGDVVIGGVGADLLYGHDGPDAVRSRDGVAGNDRLDGGAGTDTKVTDANENSVVGFP